MQACTCAITASSTRTAHDLPTCSTRAPTRTHEMLWSHVGLGSCNERRRSTGCRWRANGALAAPVQPWPSAWRRGGLWAPLHKQGELQSSASAAAATTAFGKSYKATGRAAGKQIRRPFTFSGLHPCTTLAFSTIKLTIRSLFSPRMRDLKCPSCG